MAKRVKHVVNSKEVAHLWFHKAQDSARNGGRNNFYFSGDTIFSYGSHFPIARHVTRKGKMAVLFTTRKYSVTTSKHISYTARAIPEGTLVFNVRDVEGNGNKGIAHKDNLADYKERYAALLARLPRLRSTWSITYRTRDAIALRAEIVAYTEFFGLATPKLPEVPAIDVDRFAKYEAREAIQRTAYEADQAQWAAQREIAEKERAAKASEAIAEWRAGNRQDLPYGLPAMLRLSGDGAQVETSLGASFPVEHARLALAIVRRVKESGQPWETNGRTIHLGPYKLDRIETNGDVKAGCHRVTWEEISSIANAIEGNAV